ncbi:MAG: SpoIIE family protein phosphatase [Acidobacteriota bacterium]
MTVHYLKDQSQRYEIEGDESVIGRGSDNDIKISNRSVSRHHAKLVRENDRYFIVDLNSSHGTYVNDDRIERHQLKEGDQIRLGQVEVVFTQDFLDGVPSDTATGQDLKMSLAQLSSVFAAPEDEEYSDLKKINCLLEIQYQWGQKFSPDQAFGQIIKAVLDISGAERGCIFVKKEADFKYVSGMNAKGEMFSQKQFRASQSCVKQVADTGEPVFMTGGIEGDLAQQQSVIEMNLRAIACLPLRGISGESDRLELLGILYLDSTKVMHALSGLDKKIVVKLAGEAGNGLEKLEMIRSIEERKVIEQEMSVAHEIQQRLLPQSFPKFGNFTISASCEPTRHVGGDFYDFLESRPEELIGILADVSGKGVGAAVLTALLQGALDMECRTGAPLPAVLEKTNQLMYKRSPSNGFVTVFMFSLDSSGKGEFVGAGHNPAYLFRAATGEIEELVSQGIVLGAFPSAKYESSPLELHPGDVLVIYSDGVTEAANLDDELFDEERLRAVIKEHASAGAVILEKKILEEVGRFTKGMYQTDDMTLVLIEA